MPSQKKAALITGGASGMGLAVATSLAARSDWELHLVDLNPSAGAAAAQSLPSAVFHQADVANYDSLASTFKDMFRETGRLTLSLPMPVLRRRVTSTKSTRRAMAAWIHHQSPAPC